LNPLSPLPQPSAFEERAVAKVDDLLESYMGIRDSELGELGGWGPPRDPPRSGDTPWVLGTPLTHRDVGFPSPPLVPLWVAPLGVLGTKAAPS